MKSYQKPEMTVITFEVEDVIMNSGILTPDMPIDNEPIYVQTTD